MPHQGTIRNHFSLLKVRTNLDHLAPMSFYFPPNPHERMGYDRILAVGFGSVAQNRNPQSNMIEVQGRDAVPFLTTSGLPRPVLKSVWTMVDPQHVGVLRVRAQFYTLLRFVAIGEQPVWIGCSACWCGGQLPPISPLPLLTIFPVCPPHAPSLSLSLSLSL